MKFAQVNLIIRVDLPRQARQLNSIALKRYYQLIFLLLILLAVIVPQIQLGLNNGFLPVTRLNVLDASPMTANEILNLMGSSIDTIFNPIKNPILRFFAFSCVLGLILRKLRSWNLSERP